MHTASIQDILRLDAALQIAVTDGAWQQADLLASERQNCIERLFAEIDPSELESYRETFEHLMQRDRHMLQQTQHARTALHSESSRLREQFTAANQYLQVAHLDA